MRSPCIAAFQKARSSSLPRALARITGSVILPSRKSSPLALAHGGLVGRIIDRVVDQLEGDAEVAAIGFERVLGLFAGFGDDRGDAAGGGEQGRGLGADDVEIMVFAGVDLALGGQLVDLALGDHRARRG